ncbi:MAG: hypothetical protein ACNI27_07140 [Desulfovibrio sp.]
MHDFIAQLIEKKAVACGIESVGDPSPNPLGITAENNRMELLFLPETQKRVGRKIGRFKAAQANHRTVRTAQYEVEQVVVATAYSTEFEFLKKLDVDFVKALPKRIADPENNCVRISVEKAEWKGLKNKVVDLKKKARVFHITFKWFRASDKDVPLISSIRFKVNKEN